MPKSWSKSKHESKKRNKMKNNIFSEVSKMSNDEISDIIFFVNAYNIEKVTLCYAEANRRKIKLTEKQKNGLNARATKKGYKNIEDSLIEMMKKDNFSNYDDYFTSYIENIKQSEVAEQNTLRYPALITIATVYKIVAFIIAIVAVVISVILFSTGDLGIVFSLVTLVVGGLIVLGLWAISELIHVFTDIEYNTRQNSSEH